MLRKSTSFIMTLMLSTVLLAGCAGAETESTSTDNAEYLDALDEIATESLSDTEAAESDSDYNVGKVKSFSYCLWDAVCDANRNITKEITIESGENCIYAGSMSNLYDALGISEVTVRYYLVDNDHLIEFALEDGEAALYQEIVIEDADYTESDEPYYTKLVFDSDQILSSSGTLTLISIYYPEGIPEMDSFYSYDATSVTKVSYTNSQRDGLNLQTNSYVGSNEIEISSFSLDGGNTVVTDVCPAMEFSERNTQFFHDSEDLTWNGKDARYLSFYLQDTPGDFVLGLICDGEFVTLDGDNYFIRDEQTGEDDKVLCYDITNQVTLEEGLHYMQVIVIEISSDKEVTECYDSSTDRIRIAAE